MRESTFTIFLQPVGIVEAAADPGDRVANGVLVLGVSKVHLVYLG
jgi:hypothetical protein